MIKDCGKILIVKFVKRVSQREKIKCGRQSKLIKIGYQLRLNWDPAGQIDDLVN